MSGRPASCGSNSRRVLIAGPHRRSRNVPGGWADMSREGRRVAVLLPELSASRAPLLLVGESGSGREFLARLIHMNGPFPEAPFFYAEDCVEKRVPEEEAAADGVMGGGRSGRGGDKGGGSGEGGGRGGDKGGGAGVIPGGSSEATVFLRLDAGRLPDWPPEGNLPEGTLPGINTASRLIAAVDVSADKNSAEKIKEAWVCRGGRVPAVLEVPPLRQRREDVLFLAGCFLEELAALRGGFAPALLPEAAAALVSYYWPGNVRELQRCMERAFLCFRKKHRKEGALALEMLPPEVRGFAEGPAAEGSGPGSERRSERTAFAQRQEELEAQVLRMELVRQQGNITRTARALGFTPRQVSWRMKKYGIGEER